MPTSRGALSETILTDGTLDESRATELGAGLAEALAAIHGEGLVHRDLKPSNILLASDGPRVIDLGIVRSELGAGRSATATPTGLVVGTPGHLAPEQLEGRPANAAS